MSKRSATKPPTFTKRSPHSVALPACGTPESLFAQHEWLVWDDHYRRCLHCERIEAVGVSEQAMTPLPAIIRGRGHIHEWKGHPFWKSSALIEVQYCRCGANRAITRVPQSPVYLPPTMVVHCRRNPYDIYIGRPMARYPDLKPVGWGNPFKPGPGLDAIAAYRNWLRQTPALLERLPELRGKTLGCWCAPKGEVLLGNLHGTVCHGEVLAWLADHPEDARVGVGGNAL